MSVKLSSVSFRYEASTLPALHNLDLQISSGEFVVLAGPSGCGKTTITRLINGLVPHFYTGEISGSVRVCGNNPADHPLWKTAQSVASVFQNPRTQSFTSDPRSEIAFGSENLGVPAAVTRDRVNRALHEFHIEPLANRSIFALSGGEKQRIACASAHAMQPLIYVLDEPSSNLDAEGTRALQACMSRWKASGATVIVAEHRLGYLDSLMDRLIVLHDGHISAQYSREEISDSVYKRHDLRHQEAMVAESKDVSSQPASLSLSGIRHNYSRRVVPGSRSQKQSQALNISRMSIPQGKITAILGENGAGKSTLARWLAGLLTIRGSHFVFDDQELSQRERRKKVFLVLQDVNHQLVTESVADEIAVSVALSGIAPHTREATTNAVIETMDLAAVSQHHPMALSGGQQQRLAIATALASGRDIVVLDEPTSGLDLGHMRSVAAALSILTGQGKTIIVFKHDPDLVNTCADYVVRLEHGQIVDS